MEYKNVKIEEKSCNTCGHRDPLTDGPIVMSGECFWCARLSNYEPDFFMPMLIEPELNVVDVPEAHLPMVMCMIDGLKNFGFDIKNVTWDVPEEGDPDCEDCLEEDCTDCGEFESDLPQEGIPVLLGGESTVQQILRQANEILEQIKNPMVCIQPDHRGTRLLDYFDDLDEREKACGEALIDPCEVCEESTCMTCEREVGPVCAPSDYDDVGKPVHYNEGRKVEHWDWQELGLTDEEFRGAMKYNIWKYTSRYLQKNGMQDLGKAQAYLDRLKRFEQGDRMVASSMGVEVNDAD